MEIALDEVAKMLRAPFERAFAAVTHRAAPGPVETLEVGHEPEIEKANLSVKMGRGVFSNDRFYGVAPGVILPFVVGQADDRGDG